MARRRRQMDGLHKKFCNFALLQKACLWSSSDTHTVNDTHSQTHTDTDVVHVAAF